MVYMDKGTKINILLPDQRLRLKEALKKSKMSQVELANEMGISKTTVHAWHSGVYSPSLRVILRVISIIAKNSGREHKDVLLDLFGIN
jgi:DNA-binding XRE family transcriptional regulator